jgi:hypothetical protein
VTIKYTTRARATGTRVAAAALTVGMAFAIAGCGGGGGKAGAATKSSTAPTAGATRSGGSRTGSPAPGPTQTLAEVKGEKGVVLAITDAERDAGGFVTVQGTVTNTGDQIFNATRWVGTEQEVQRSGSSLAGAVLVDPKGKKRYYVLRDTEGRCLCTMKLYSVEPKESVPVFAQFPAPPASVTQVDFELPTMPPATITISG